MQRIQTFWKAQLAAEYSSAAITAEFAQCLLQTGSSPDLVQQCLDIAKDEVDHASLCHEVLAASGADNVAPELNPVQLKLPVRHTDPRKNLLDTLLRFYCLGETVAVPLFSAMQKEASESVVLKTHKRILSDEPRHSQFGWLTLAWANSVWPETQSWLAEIFPDALKYIAGQYYSSNEFNPPLSIQEKQWGMISQQQYAEVFDQAVSGLYAKNLRYYHIDVDTIWAEIKPGL